MSYNAASLWCKASQIYAQDYNVLTPRDSVEISNSAVEVGRAVTTLQLQYVTFDGQQYLLPRPAQAKAFSSPASLLAYKKGLAIAANYTHNPPSLNIPAIRQIYAICLTGNTNVQ